MEAILHVMLITAIWKEPAVFSGYYDLSGPGAPVRYLFRAEREKAGGDATFRFTRLCREGDAEGLADYGTLSRWAYEILGVALARSVGLLHARILERFAAGNAVPAEEGLEMKDLGFQVRLPFTPQSPEATAALQALLRGPVGPG